MTQLYITMPQPGETISEGTLVEWLIKPGAEVKEGSPLAQLETEKAVFEYESPFDGKILKLLHDNGTRVKVATPIAIIEVAEDKAKNYIMMGIGKPVGDAQYDSRSASHAEDKIEAKQRTQIAAEILYKPKSSPDERKAPLFPRTAHGAQRITISPFIRQLAKSHNLSEDVLTSLADADGRVTKEAIENFVSGKGGSRTAPAGDFDTIPCTAIRMRIAENMVLSKSKIPHAHNGIAIDLTNVVAHREKNKEKFKQKNGTPLNFLSIIYPALLAAIKKVPVVNASYDDSTSKHQIKIFKKINLGIAAGTEHGLVIPVIHNIESMSFLDFNKKLNDKLERATKQKLMPEDLVGATLIFNNFGFFGTQMGVQVIQYPMAATLGMSAIEERAVVKSGQVVVRTMCDFILSFDHRVMDGRETGIFLSTLKKEIESSALLAATDG